ncbi:MAG: hypothetical protein A2140_04120 [Candidatus Muproteobacteria bacterium RBG_16_62_13]|uniref:Copper-binding protein n=1 Tax=Candidatus Muproteobacteria bacterium RBG_16_62_13 TaxID=1817756 RepID=A0A1F6T1H1_9PROT|nr:MAG: hypothetical protein A2140_04120 [Candidatus Muproteobacteria bacterium RBG_16_62_13]
MNATKYVVIALLGTLLTAGPSPGAHAGERAAQGPLVSTAAPQVHKGEGVVKEVDAGKNRIKIEHGPIQSLGWSGMTMFIDVANAGLLTGIQPGDKVTFDLSQGKDGRFVITRMAPRR